MKLTAKNKKRYLEGNTLSKQKIQLGIVKRRLRRDKMKFKSKKK